MALTRPNSHTSRGSPHPIFGGGGPAGTSLTFIKDFLSERCNTLLVKGFAGTGKTTLALDVLREFKGKRRGVYLSTRVSYQRLKQQYPWVGEVLAPKDVRPIEARTKASSYQDVRLGDVKMLLQIALDALSAHEDPLLIFDSWDALANELDPIERLKAEKSLLAAIDGRKANAVFISEDPERSSLNYPVDGVIILRSRLHEGVRLREMVIEKLRGRLIDKPVRLYTLREGRFEELPEFRYSVAPNPKRFDPLPNTDSHYSTGLQSIDSVLNGGFRRSSIVLLEIAPDTNRIVLSALLGIQVLNFINNGKLAVIGLSQDMEDTAVLRHLQPYSDKESMGNLNMVKFSKVDQIFDGYTKAKAKGGKSALVEFDSSYADVGDNFERMLELCRGIRENKDLLIIVSDGSSQGITVVKRLVDLHVKVWQSGDYALVKNVRTAGRTFAMDFRIDHGKPSLALVEMV